MNIERAIERLNEQLPLLERQRALSPQLAAVHRAILRSFIERGRPLSASEIASMLDDGDAAAALRRLASDDLIVLDRDGVAPVGAYPMTIEETPHRVAVAGNRLHAMCALDAVSIAPMFDVEAAIESRCHVTGATISILQRGRQVIDVRPNDQVRVGVRWQQPTGAAAHSMCLEMVFLRDADTAAGWQDGNTAGVALFQLDDAIAFGAGFFRPLLEPDL